MQNTFLQTIILSIALYCCEAGIKYESGICSWYGDEGEIPPGWPTASGEGFDRFEMAAAHKTLPFGTVIRVKNGVNGKTVDVRINDRGPFIAGRIVDLTYASFGILEDRGVGLIHDCSYEIVNGLGNPELMIPHAETETADKNIVPTENAYESGICSWYGDEGEIPPGWPTASGEGFDRFDMTAAHKTLPFGTVIRVKNGVNGKTVDVRINDRGPFIPGRIVDLSFASFGIVENRDTGLIYDCSYEIIEDRYGNSGPTISKPSSKKNPPPENAYESGICSWNGDEIPQGWPTASGEGFDQYAMSAAHKTLPFGSLIRVRNGGNAKTVDVRINDRGPFIPGRIVSLTLSAFEKLDYKDVGLIEECSFEIINESQEQTKNSTNSASYFSNQVDQNDQGVDNSRPDYFDERQNNVIEYY